MASDGTISGGRSLTYAQFQRFGDCLAQLSDCSYFQLPQVLVAGLTALLDGMTVLALRVIDGHAVVLAGAEARVSAAQQDAAIQAVATGTPVLRAMTPGVGRTYRGTLSRAILPWGPRRRGTLVIQVCSRIEAIDPTEVELLEQLVPAARRHGLDDQGLSGAESGLFKVLAGSLDDGVVVTSGPDAHVVYANGRLGELLGERHTRLVGRSVRPTQWTWFDADGREVDLTPLQEAHARGTAARQLNRVMPSDVDPDSETGRAAMRSLLVHTLPMQRDGEGGAGLVVTRVRDVTRLSETDAVRQEQEERLTTLELISGLAWWHYQPATGSVLWSAELYRVAGLDPHGARITWSRFLDLVHPEDRHRVADSTKPEAESVHSLDFRIRRPDGELRYLRGWLRRYLTAEGEPRIVATSLDDSARYRALQRAEAQREQFERSFDGTPYGTLLISLSEQTRGMVLRANVAFQLLIGEPSERQSVGELLHLQTDTGPVPIELEALLQLGRLGGHELHRFRRVDGETVWGWITAVAIEDLPEVEPFLIVHVLDMTTHTQQQQALVELARTDSLTGLPNRFAVSEVLDELCRRPAPATALMLNLDRLRAVNDRFGHVIGDQVILATARRLRAALPLEVTLGRLGGDEFVVVLSGRDRRQVAELAEDLLQCLSRPLLEAAGNPISAAISIGIARQRPGDTPAVLLRDAELALTRAKQQGGRQLAWCDDDLRALTVRRLDLEERLRTALRQDGLRVFRQPIRHAVPGGALFGHEALVRLYDPEIGLVGAGDFIPVAEQSGLIVDVDHWMLEKVLELIAIDHGYRLDPAMRVTVNFSPSTLQRAEFDTRIRAAVRRAGVGLDRLVLEITESALLPESGSWLALLDGLRAEGLWVAIDDFGAGYSGVSYLRSVRPDLLKIDRSFITELNNPDPKARSTVAAMLQLGQARGVQVLGEGVETELEREALRSMGCDLLQGYLLGRPEPWTPDSRGT